MIDGGAPSTLDACAAACTEAGHSCVAFEIWGCLATPGTCAGQSCLIMHGQVRQGEGVTVEAAATYYSDPASGNEKCFQRAGADSFLRADEPNHNFTMLVVEYVHRLSVLQLLPGVETRLPQVPEWSSQISTPKHHA
jgi:hypothetical protein